MADATAYQPQPGSEPEDIPVAAGETEVEFRPDDADFDQKPEAPVQDAKEESEDILEAIIPSAEPRVWEIGGEKYIQRPLNFLGKMQWFSLIGNALDRALSGENAISVNSLFTAPTRGGEMRAEDFRDADTFIHAVAKLLSVAPNFLVDSYCIWLNVPDYERPLVVEQMKLPVEDGGMSDDMGMDIIETFLDQNYDALANFFGDRIGKLQQRVTKLNEIRAARRSKR